MPERVVDNDEIGGMLGIEAGWIEPRTGIRQRRYAGEDEAVSDLAVGAGGEALHRAGVYPLEVDLLVLATSTPDHLLPPTASLVASRLGIHNAGAFDLAGACTGFLNAFTMAAASIESGRARRALIVGANILSRRVNPADRSTAILFGDGAGALLLGLMEGERGLLAAHHGTNGAYYGNTSAASIPMAVHEAISEGHFRAGDRIDLAAFGAGFTYASVILVW